MSFHIKLSKSYFSILIFKDLFKLTLIQFIFNNKELLLKFLAKNRTALICASKEGHDFLFKKMSIVIYYFLFIKDYYHVHPKN